MANSLYLTANFLRQTKRQRMSQADEESNKGCNAWLHLIVFSHKIFGLVFDVHS